MTVFGKSQNYEKKSFERSPILFLQVSLKPLDFYSLSFLHLQGFFQIPIVVEESNSARNSLVSFSALPIIEASSVAHCQFELLNFNNFGCFLRISVYIRIFFRVCP